MLTLYTGQIIIMSAIRLVSFVLSMRATLEDQKSIMLNTQDTILIAEKDCKERFKRTLKREFKSR